VEEVAEDAPEAPLEEDDFIIYYCRDHTRDVIYIRIYIFHS
jgi:hypothetical protein